MLVFQRFGFDHGGAGGEDLQATLATWVLTTCELPVLPLLASIPVLARPNPNSVAVSAASKACQIIGRVLSSSKTPRMKEGRNDLPPGCSSQVVEGSWGEIPFKQLYVQLTLVSNLLSIPVLWLSIASKLAMLIHNI